MSISITVKDRTPELMAKVEAAIGRFVVKGAATLILAVRPALVRGFYRGVIR